MEAAVEAGNGVSEAKALARAAATILASVIVGGVLTRVEADDLLGRQIKRRRAAMERFPAEDLKLLPTIASVSESRPADLTFISMRRVVRAVLPI
jgi:hypothetical protein